LLGSGGEGEVEVMNPTTVNSNNEGTTSLADRAPSLSPRERAILEALLERPGRPISRRQLRERLYGAKEPEVLGNPVEVHIHNLRAKLGAGVIRTVRGLGYFIVPVQP
jgi:two-component system response regulator QseB